MPAKPDGTLPGQDTQNNQANLIPAKVREGLSPQAAERLQRYVDSSERFQRRVYGEDTKPRP